MGSKPYGVIEPDHVPQDRLSVDDWEAGEVDALIEETIEEIEVDRDCTAAGPYRIAQLHPLLQAGKAGDLALRIEGHDLSIQHGISPHRQLQCLHQLGVGTVQWFVIPGVQVYRSTADENQSAHPVQLGLVDPLAFSGQ